MVIYVLLVFSSLGMFVQMGQEVLFISDVKAKYRLNLRKLSQINLISPKIFNCTASIEPKTMNFLDSTNEILPKMTT